MNIYELAKRLEVITVEDVERYTIIELIYMICDKLNNTTTTLKGLIEVGLNQAVAEQLMKWIEDGTLEEELSNLVLKVPYRDYDRTETGIGYGENNNKIYEGFSQFAKKTYGRYEQGTVVSIMANADNPKPELTGTDTKGLSWYVGRDSCALYVANSAGQPSLTLPANSVIYHANDCVLPVNTNMSQIKVGMILDTAGTENVDWYVGIVKKIEGTTLILEDGWYLVRTDGVESSKGVPNNGLGLRINWNSKVWNIDSNMFIHSGCPAGANMELGIFCEHSYINDVGGIDLINMGSNDTHYGIKVRHKESNNGFNEAFISDDNHVHYTAWTADDNVGNVPLIRSMNKGNNAELFSIRADGLIKGQKLDWEVITSDKTVADGKSIVLINGNCNLGLPSGNGGRLITLVVLAGGTVLLTAPNGMGIKSFDVQQQQVNISKGNATHRVITIFSDGGTWYYLSDSGVN